MPKKVAASSRRESLRAALQGSRPVSPAATPSVPQNAGTRDPSARSRSEDDRWRVEKQTLRQAAAELAQRRAQQEVAAMSDLATVDKDTPLEVITESLEDPSTEVRNAAVRALYRLNPEFAASFFNRALREGPQERRRRIGAALAGSGLVSEAIQHLKAGTHKNPYGTISLLFLVAKAGEVQPLITLVENHPSIELRLALIELLALSGETAIVPAFRRLAVRSSLPPEVRSAVMEAIYQITTQSPSDQ